MTETCGAREDAEHLVVEPGSNEDRVIQATLRCVARWGVAKSTLDDIASEAGVSRATVYRAFPGGKDVVLASVLQHELRSYFVHATERLAAAETLEDLLITGIHETHRFIVEHDALGFLLAHEAEFVLSRLAANQLDSVLAVATAFVAPHLERFVEPASAVEHAEWIVRNFVSYSLNPSDRVDLGDRDSVTRLVKTYFLPVLASARDLTTNH